MAKKQDIVKARKAFIGGSSTFSIDFPGVLKLPGVKTKGRRVFFTPFGESPEFTIFEIDREPVLTVKMHGWRAGVSRATSSRQVFWVFQKAGVRTILAEGGIGAMNQEYELCDLFIPDDYIDLSLRKDVSISDDYLLIMRDPFCANLSEILKNSSKKILPQRRIHRGVYVVTDGRHFESRAEVKMMQSFGGDVIGQSLCPEVYLAREIGACYSGIYLVVNRAEGIGNDWSHAELKKIFYSEGLHIGRIILESLKRLKTRKAKKCTCSLLRKKTLLKKR
jgi:5'-methylthioadenosine phosphorylase